MSEIRNFDSALSAMCIIIRFSFLITYSKRTKENIALESSDLNYQNYYRKDSQKVMLKKPFCNHYTRRIKKNAKKNWRQKKNANKKKGKVGKRRKKTKINVNKTKNLYRLLEISFGSYHLIIPKVDYLKDLNFSSLLDDFQTNLNKSFRKFFLVNSTRFSLFPLFSIFFVS